MLPLSLAPEASAPGGGPPAFRLRSGVLEMRSFCILHSSLCIQIVPRAPNRMPGQVAVRKHLRPCERWPYANTCRQIGFNWGKWSSIWVSLPVFRFGRPACISQHLCSKYEIGVPCEICTHVRSFADRCLSYSANGTYMAGGSFRLRPRCCLPLGVLEPFLVVVRQDLVANKVRDDCRSSRIEANHVQHAAVVRVGEGEAI